MRWAGSIECIREKEKRINKFFRENQREDLADLGLDGKNLVSQCVPDGKLVSFLFLSKTMNFSSTLNN
jgi:hypothetical protein